MADRVGEQLGNYTLTQLLGKGGFAEVYLGEHIYLKTNAAIKVLHAQLTDSEIEQFLHEARTIAHLEHPNIVRVFEFGIDGSIPFLIMSFAANGSLRQRHPRGKQVAIPTIRHYVRQIADALQYIHNQKLIHRDIKPRNLLVGSKSEILLSDFGVALMALSSRHQSIQDMAGTITYMAPEQIQGKPRLASDQYALGVVIYEWLCGELPFQGAFSEIASQHLLTPPPSLSEKVPKLSPDIEAVVMRALSKDPQRRYQSIMAFAAAFEQACEILPFRPSATVDLKNSPLADTTSTPPVEIPSLPSEGTRSSQKPTLPLTASTPISDDLEDTPAGVSYPSYSLQLPLANAAEEEDTQQPAPFAASPAPAARQTRQLENQASPAPQWSQPLPQPQPGGFFPAEEVVRRQGGPITPIAITPSKARNRNRPSLMVTTFVLMAVILLLSAFFVYYVFQAVTTTAVTVNFGPKIMALSERYPITATFSTPSVDATNAIIPLHGIKLSQPASASGRATGQVNCIFGTFGCQTGVSLDDVTTLANQERLGLETSLTQALNQQMASVGGTKVGAITFNDTSVTSNPTVGQASNTVTVTLTEQAGVVYYVTADAQGVARQELVRQAQQQGANYVLVSSTVQVGLPKVTGIDAATGKVSLSVAAGGDVVYQFPASQLQAIQNALKGLTVNDARAYLAGQPGIDPATISVNFTQGSGDTLPGDIQHIKIGPLNPSNYPPIQLTTIPTTGLSPIPTATLTPRPSPKPKATANP